MHRDNSTAQNHYENMPIFYGYKEILQPFFQSSLVEQHSSEISQLELVEDIKQDNLNRVEDFIYCSLIALSHGELRIEETHLHSFIFEQHEGIILYEFHDRMASWMELYFQRFLMLQLLAYFLFPVVSIRCIQTLYWIYHIFSGSSQTIACMEL